MASCYQAIRDGLWNAAMNMSLEQLEKEFSKNEKEDGIYLEQGREYRSEKNIFEYYSEDERYRKFGIPPKTVYENLLHFQQFPDKLSVLKKDDIFTDEIIDSYASSILEKWVNQLSFHMIENNMKVVRSFSILHDNNQDISDLDIVNWTKINALRWELMKDSVDKKCLFSRIKNALLEKNYSYASDLQLEMDEKMALLKTLYTSYQKNIF